MIAKNERAAVSLEKLKAEKRQLELQLNLERTRRLVEALDSKINCVILSLPPMSKNPRDLLEIASAVKTLAQELHSGGEVRPPRNSQPVGTQSARGTNLQRPLIEDAPPFIQSADPTKLPSGLVDSVAPRPVTVSRCDLNGDGAVNVVDAQIAISQVLGMTPCTSADLVGDKKCDLRDLQRVINASIGGTCQVGI